MRTRFAFLLLAATLAACTGTPGPTPTPAGTGSGPTAQASEPAATAGAPTQAAPSEAPATEAPTATDTPAPTEPSASGPVSSGPPMIDSMQIVRTASCSSDNGTGTVGMIQITWSASGTTGVRISIDPPSPDVAYNYGFADYPPSGSADVPFACSPPNSDAKGYYHLYVVSTLKVAGHTFYRYAKVYDTVPAATAP